MTTSMKSFTAPNLTGRSNKRTSPVAGRVALGAALLMLTGVLAGGGETASEAVAANDEIGKCSDQGCTEFVACMTFSAAPERFGFVGQ